MVSTVFHYGRGRGIYSVPLPFLHQEPWRYPQHRKTCIHLHLAFSVVDNTLLLVNGDLVFEMHQHGFESVDSFETYL